MSVYTGPKGDQGERGEQGERGDAGQNSDWKTYLLGVFFTIIMASCGMVYSGTTARITNIETIQADNAETVKTTAVQIAVLQESMKDLQKSIDKLDASQTQLLDKMDVLLTGIARDSKRWNDEMDRMSKLNGKGKD